MRSHDWSEIERCSGLARADLEGVGRTYAQAKAVIANYGMGLTQHRHGTQNVQMLCNLLLMRGNIGTPGAGISPIRGHSNVQGQRTVGITEKPELAPLDKFAEFYGFEPPREEGARHGRGLRGHSRRLGARPSSALGGNFVRAVPETELDGGGLDEAAPVRPDRDEAEPQPSPARRGDLSPALPRPHRGGRAGERQAARLDGGFHRLHPRLDRLAPAGEPRASVGAEDRRRTRQGDRSRPIHRALGRLGRRLFQGARCDRARLSAIFQGLQPALPAARRLPPRSAGLPPRVGDRDEEGELLHPHRLRREPRHRGGRQDDPDADDGALQRPVQHHDLRLRRPPARHFRLARA